MLLYCRGNWNGRNVKLTTHYIQCRRHENLVQYHIVPSIPNWCWASLNERYILGFHDTFDTSHSPPNPGLLQFICFTCSNQLSWWYSVTPPQSYRVVCTTTCADDISVPSKTFTALPCSILSNLWRWYPLYDPRSLPCSILSNLCWWYICPRKTPQPPRCACSWSHMLQLIFFLFLTCLLRLKQHNRYNRAQQSCSISYGSKLAIQI